MARLPGTSDRACSHRGSGDGEQIPRRRGWRGLGRDGELRLPCPWSVVLAARARR